MELPTSPTRTISKSGFKIALDCLLKLKHRHDGLRETGEQDDMLRLLSEGGGTIEALARAVEPADFTGPQGGHEVASSCLEAFRSEFARATRHGMGDPRRLRELTIVDGAFLGRLDLLRVWEDRIELIEQKSKSISTAANGGTADELFVRARWRVASAWIPYLQDIGFQAELFRRWLRTNAEALGVPTDIAVVPKLMLVNKDGRAGSADCLRNFSASYRINGRRVEAEVRHVGPAPVTTSLLVELDVSHGFSLMTANAQASDAMLAGKGIGECMDAVAAIASRGRWPIPRDSIGVRCKGCEYRVPGDADSGFVHCWGKDPTARDHILRLTRCSDAQFVEATRGIDPADAPLTRVARASLTPTQVRQWETAASCTPWTRPDLPTNALKVLGASRSGPVAFLDFETVAYQIPARVGGAPYEKVPFQFEVVLLPSAAAPLSDRIGLDGFLDLVSPDPRRGFVRALEAQLASAATVYHWSPFERTVLEAVRESLRSDPRAEPGDTALVAFIDSLLAKLLDLMSVCKDTYLHPDMAGSYSIKRVLPVVWSDPAIRREFAAGAARRDPIAYDDPADPYQSLAGLGKPFLEAIGGTTTLQRIEDRDDAKGIQGGGTASLYYHWVRCFGDGGNPEVERVFRDYCRLDARAMLMVFRMLRGR